MIALLLAKCERLLIAVVLLSEVDNLSDAVLCSYDIIEEIITFLDDATNVHVTAHALTQSSQRLVWRSRIKREGLVTAVSCTCTILPKTGASNQIVVFQLKHFRDVCLRLKHGRR